MNNKKNEPQKPLDSLKNCNKSSVEIRCKDADQTHLMPNPPEDWIDAFDVMDLLHISRRTLHSLQTGGILPYSRIRRKLYYKRSDIERILHNNYVMYKLHNGNK